MVRQFIDQDFERFDDFLPFGVGVGGDGIGNQVSCEFLAGVGVWVHGVYVKGSAVLEKSSDESESSSNRPRGCYGA